MRSTARRRRLRFALTEIGFYFIVNHGVPREQIRAVFEQVRRFHAQPIEKKMALKLDPHNTGYLPMRGNTLRTSTVQAGTKPNLNEAFFVKRELPPDHPDVLADRRYRGPNRWPDALPGFRETIVGYCETLERLVQKMVRLYARALDLPAEYFDTPFHDPQYSLRMTHYPHQDGPVVDEFGLAPHTDTSFLTLLAPNDVPGLSIRTQSGKWIDAPAIADAYVVNGGQMLQRWTNDLFLATPHRAINRTRRRALRHPLLLRQQHRLAGRRRADHRRARQAAEISHDLLQRLHGLVSEAELRRAQHSSRRRMSAPAETIPVIDLGPYLAGDARRDGDRRRRAALRADRDRLLLHRQSRRAGGTDTRRLPPGRALSRAATRQEDGGADRPS